MDHVIRSENGLKVRISDHGAELLSIHYGDTEYLWQGDPTYWKGHAPVLFPFVGRLYNGKYRLGDKVYDLRIHGFAPVSDFEASQEKDKAVFTLKDNEETLKSYPFHFVFQVIYAVSGQTLSVTYHVENKSDTMMPFGIGGHPGFNVPLRSDAAGKARDVAGKDTSAARTAEDGLQRDFTDYYLEFDGKSEPDRVIMTDQVLVSGKTEPYPLEDGRILRLRHDLFDNDAVVLENMPGSVTLKSDKDSRSVTVSFPDMRNVGFWHRNRSDAPYVAIEPWYSLPGRQDIIEDLRFRRDLVRLQPGESWETEMTITVR